MSYFLSYCPYQKNFHIETEETYWDRVFDIYKRTDFEGCAYVPIKKFETYGAYVSWFKSNILA
jgi:hypothetical protein